MGLKRAFLFSSIIVLLSLLSIPTRATSNPNFMGCKIIEDYFGCPKSPQISPRTFDDNSVVVVFRGFATPNPPGGLEVGGGSALIDAIDAGPAAVIFDQHSTAVAGADSALIAPSLAAEVAPVAEVSENKDIAPVRANENEKTFRSTTPLTYRNRKN